MTLSLPAWARGIIGGLIFAASLTACSLSTGGSAAPTASPPPSPTPTIAAPQGRDPLSIAWIDGGDLFVWRSNDQLPRRIASGAVIRPFLSPDGEQVAYLRGPSGNAQTLWISDTRGANERQLAGADTLANGDEARLIGQVVWSPDSQRVYFNTITGSAIDRRPADDLWQAIPATGHVERLLADGEGGQITPNPEGTWLAMVTAGTYTSPIEPAQAAGEIAFYDTATGARAVALSFTPVATASETRWYPALRWRPDGRGVRVAMPPPELVYGEGEDFTVLWELPLEGAPHQLGAVAADFFGMPVFSADGQWIAFIARRESPEQTAIYG